MPARKLKTRQKLSKIMKIIWKDIRDGKRKDYFHTTEWRKKFGQGKTGIKNHNWSGDKPSYRALHKWVQKWKGKPKVCSQCNSSPLISSVLISPKRLKL